MRPPSPSAKRFFVGKKLKVEQTPLLATPAAPKACAESSISGSPSAARSPRCHVLGVEIERVGVDVGEHRSRADAGDRLRRCVEGERGADDLVARTDAHRLEREHERIRPVRDADRVRHIEVRSRLALECLDLRAEDEPARFESLGVAFLELGYERRVLRFDVDEWDHEAPSVPSEHHA